MAIKILKRRLNEFGKIKIGRKGEEVESSGGKTFRMPERIDHFILTTTEKDETGQFIEDVVLMDKLKKSGRAIVNKDGNLTGIPIRLLYDDTELNFPTRLACYVAGKLSCYGDGEKAWDRVSDYKKEKVCPCARFNGDYEGKDKCKATGALTCVIDEAELFGQTHKFRTTSINSIEAILGGIDLIKTATQKRIAGMPLMLLVTNKSVVIPAASSQTTIQVVSLCYRGDMLALRRDAIQLLEENRKYLLGMKEIEAEAIEAGAGKIIEDEEDERDFIREFVPGAVVTETVPEDTTPEVTEKTERPSVKQVIATPQEKELVSRLENETDISKATALAKRIKKEVLFDYMVKKYPNKSFFEDTKKPDLVKLLEVNIKEQMQKREDSLGGFVPSISSVILDQMIEIAKTGKHIDLANHLTEYFKPEPINRTLSIPDLLALAEKKIKGQLEKAKDIKNKIEGTKEKPQKNDSPQKKDVYAWDDGAPIDREQKIEIADLKSNLKISPADWPKRVAEFRDKDNNRLTTAVKMTFKQAEAFIDILSDELIKSKKSV